MNKTDLILSVSLATELSKAAAARTVDAAVEAIMRAVTAGESVTLVGFGTFKATKRAARTGTNPRTGKPIVIAARHAPKFTAGRTFKAAVAGRKARRK